MGGEDVAHQPSQVIGRESMHSGPLLLGTPPVRDFGHVPALDGVRAVAVLTILAFHMARLRGYQQPLPGGHLGVQLFFVLSGFLITALLLRERGETGTINLPKFWGRRALRLFPALWVVLAVHTLYAGISDYNGRAQANTVVSAVFYFVNWRAIWEWPAVSDLGHLWSLSIEEQFYLVWPLVLVGLIALRVRVSVAITFLVLAVVLMVENRWVRLEGGENAFWLNLRTEAQADTIVIGCLAALLWSYGKVPRRGVSIAATVGAGYLLWSFANVNAAPRSYEGSRILFAVAAAVVILAAVEGRWFLVWFLALRPMRAIGRVSYGLYLWHLPVNVAVANRMTARTEWERVGAALSLTVAGTLLSWFLVEKPLQRRFRQRLQPPRAQSDPSRSSTETIDGEPDGEQSATRARP